MNPKPRFPFRRARGLAVAGAPPYVANSNKRSTRAIKAREVRQYGGVSRRTSADGIIDHAH